MMRGVCLPSSAAGIWCENKRVSSCPVSKQSPVAGGAPSRVVSELSTDISFKQVEHRVSSVIPVVLVHLDVNAATVERICRVVVPDRISRGAPIKHDRHVHSVKNVVFN